MIEHVRSAVQKGWHVFPLMPGTKQPHPGSRGQNQSTTDLRKVERWWGRLHVDDNYGVHARPSGLYVVDVDAGPGKVGRETWVRLNNEHGLAPTFTVETPSGGWHLYYQAPPGVELRNTAGALGPNVDTRGNGYVVGPWSVVDGRTYRVIKGGDPQPLPGWIVETLKPKPIAMQSFTGDKATAEEVMHRVRNLADQLADAPEGEGNDTAARIAFMVGGYVGAGQVDAEEALSELVAALDDWSWRDSKSRQAMYNTVRTCLTAGAEHPRAWLIGAEVDCPFDAMVPATTKTLSDVWPDL